ncbi:MAG TPA: tetratricopeptide repeat protein, partial [Umezawaea sp.]|nr:tetratricopeptide repeat protein [Umezawaea sp.]
ALNAAGLYAARLGDHHVARRHCEAALSLQRRYCNAQGEANALRNLGEISTMMGHEMEAAQQFRAALKLYRDNGVTAAEAELTTRLGEPLRTYAVWQETWQACAVNDGPSTV